MHLISKAVDVSGNTLCNIKMFIYMENYTEVELSMSNEMWMLRCGITVRPMDWARHGNSAHRCAGPERIVDLHCR
jgi:hypothetical protein